MTLGERESLSWTNFMNVLGNGHRGEGQAAFSSQHGQKEREREKEKERDWCGRKCLQSSAVTSVKTSCPWSFAAAPLPPT